MSFMTSALVFLQFFIFLIRSLKLAPNSNFSLTNLPKVVNFYCSVFVYYFSVNIEKKHSIQDCNTFVTKYLDKPQPEKNISKQILSNLKNYGSFLHNCNTHGPVMNNRGINTAVLALSSNNSNLPHVNIACKHIISKACV